MDGRLAEAAQVGGVYLGYMMVMIYLSPYDAPADFIYFQF